MKIAVVIVSYNGAPWLPRCLASLQAAQPPAPGIWVVDNASTDDTVAVVRAQFPQVHLLENAQNLGFAAGTNRGIQAALADGAEYVVLLNQDMTVEAGWLAELHQVAGGGPPGIFGALELTYDGQGLDPLCRRNLCEQAPQFVDDLCFGRVQRAYASNVAFGGSLAIHRTVFAKIGYLDELFFMYCEDIDFSRRARRAGVGIWLLPQCRVRHHSSMTSEGGYRSPRIARLNRRGWMILALKNPERAFGRALAGELRDQVRKFFRNALRCRWADAREGLADTGWLLQQARRIRAARHRDLADHGAELAKWVPS